MSAILSTASIFLNVGSAALTRDIPLSLGRPLANPIFWARAWTGILAVAAGALALASRELVALLGAIGYGLHAAALVPTLVIGLHWQRSTAGGVVASAVVAVCGSLYFSWRSSWGLLPITAGGCRARFRQRRSGDDPLDADVHRGQPGDAARRPAPDPGCNPLVTVTAQRMPSGSASTEARVIGGASSAPGWRVA